MARKVRVECYCETKYDVRINIVSRVNMTSYLLRCMKKVFTHCIHRVILNQKKKRWNNSMRKREMYRVVFSFNILVQISYKWYTPTDGPSIIFFSFVCKCIPQNESCANTRFIYCISLWSELFVSLFFVTRFSTRCFASWSYLSFPDMFITRPSNVTHKIKSTFFSTASFYDRMYAFKHLDNSIPSVLIILYHKAILTSFYFITVVVQFGRNKRKATSQCVILNNAYTVVTSITTR